MANLVVHNDMTTDSHGISCLPAVIEVPSTQVLTDADLLHYIFMFISSTSDYRYRSYLARYAVVRRAFHDPAIRLLWRNLNSLLPLWHLLAPPKTPFPQGSKSGQGEVLSYLQKIDSARLYLDPNRWRRFREHATHVRSIAHGSPGTTKLQAILDASNPEANGHLVQSVVVHNGGKSILPLLRTVQWRQRAPGEDTLIPLFTSTLRHITIGLMGPDEGVHISLLRRLREASPLLDNIGLITPDDLLRLGRSNAIIQELVYFSRLQQVQLSRVSGPEAFYALATIPGLTALTVLDVTGTWTGASHTVSIRHLEELSLTGDAPELLNLFNRLRLPTLKTAIIHITSFRAGLVASEDVTLFLSRFCNAVSDSSLRSLHLSLRVKPSVGELPSLRDRLAPILPLRGLRVFNFGALIDMIATFDDEDVDALACAWPNVERLYIGEGSNSDSTSSVSFNALFCLHKRCVYLQELSIPRLRWPTIGVHSIPAPLDGLQSRSTTPDGLAETRNSHPLQRLTVRYAYLPKTMSTGSLGPELSDEAAEAMARYLLDLFPRLEPEQYKGAAQAEKESGAEARNKKNLVRFDGRWRKVSALVYVLRCARDGLPLGV